MSTGSSTQVARRGGVFPRLRDVRIRAKLALILLVPIAAVIGLAGVRLIDVGQRATTAGQVEDLTRLGADVSALTQLLQAERMSAAAYLSDSAVPPEAYDRAVKATDAQAGVYHEHRGSLEKIPSTVDARLRQIDDHLNSLNLTRGQVAKRQNIAVAEAVSRYGVVITDLVGYGQVVSQFAGDGPTGDSLRAAGAFAEAKAGAAELEAIAYAARVSNDLSPEQRTAFIAAQTSQQEALLSFEAFAPSGQRQMVDSVVTGDAVNLADRVANELNRGTAVAPSDITQSLGAVVDLMRWAEQQMEAQNIKSAADDRDGVMRQAAIETTLVLLVLAIAIALAVLLARTLNMSLRRLREGALAVANRDLPDAVARLRDVRNLGEGGVDYIVDSVRDPIRLDNRDEIGQVAQAFNVVHQEAVRIAAEQAALRTSVSAMFLNLARRSQSLVDRMIGELDLIERTEEDPKRLARLFELDHLATRMRRNDENLLVLAGADSSPPRREDALLIDALRAAQSEVELYNRIEFGTVDSDIEVSALAVNDVVRLAAELLDNATRFSPPTTIVVAEARRIRDYVVIQVEDRGLGMSEEQMDQLNRRLAEPPGVDVAAFRLMGLAVVGRLASRYGIRVELRANLEGGTIAQVTLPGTIVVMPSGRGQVSMPGPSVPVPPPLSSAGWDATPSRAATATLPAPAHPQLPMFPSQRPPTTIPDPDVTPTPNRPPLPSRAARPAVAAPSGVAPAAAAPAAVAPTSENNGWGAALAAMPPVPAPPPPVAPQTEERADAPIFVQMQQSWFKNHDGMSPEEWGMPTAGYAPPPNAASASPSAPVLPPPAAPAPVAATPAPAPTGNGHNGASPTVPKPRAAAEDRWKTAADEGWQRAMAAAEPVDAGTTRSGLPKRVPQAQLVPGGVQAEPRNQNRRSPDEVKGLLSAYHRGVQRGRTDGIAETAAFQAKENEQ
ncbi:sensor histidine kinase [Actinoplanes sp. TBRC 11911]|uniref:sensor histidine kinase n=1 Tax=Actinoplanes sp. TBRC 11911 TaxID=2729386 RepID=UPI00145E38EE|nr:nitrate- and nitrite sensing domain-containing protein [Actinoplanes sp. TBRC 11911]NMO56488.1 sensor histidine kinase [Actinoplanes sp. TBRC 11911]